MSRRSNLALVLIPLLASCGAGAAGSSGGLTLIPDPAAPVDGLDGPDVRPRANFHDFGRVQDGLVVEHVFRFRNDEGVPVMIQSVKPDCGCSVPSVSYRTAEGLLVKGKPATPAQKEILEIPPGCVADLALRMETKDVRIKNSDKAYTTRITTTSTRDPYLTFEVHLYVEKPFEVVPNGLQFGKVAIHGDARKSVEVVQAGGFAKRVKGIRSAPPGVVAELVHEVRFDRDVWILRASLEPPVAPGAFSSSIWLETENEDGTPNADLEIKLAGQGVDDITTDTGRLIAKNVAGSGESARGEIIVFTLLPGQRLRASGAEILDPVHAELCVLELLPVAPDDAGSAARWRVRLTSRAGLEPQVLEGRLRVRLDDPNYPVIEVPYVVHLR